MNKIAENIIKAVKKTEKGCLTQNEVFELVLNATNPHFKKAYADINALLDAVEPILLENGLLLLQHHILHHIVVRKQFMN